MLLQVDNYGSESVICTEGYEKKGMSGLFFCSDGQVSAMPICMTKPRNPSALFDTGKGGRSMVADTV